MKACRKLAAAAPSLESLNAVVDGLFYLAVKHEERTWPHYGRFLQVDRPRRVEYTWMSEATKGAESIVTVTMEARERKPKSHSTTRVCRTTRWGVSTKKAGPGFCPRSLTASHHGGRLPHQIGRLPQG